MKKKIISTLVIVLGYTAQQGAWAHDHPGHTHPPHPSTSVENTIEATVIFETPLAVGSKASTQLMLTTQKDGKPLLPSDIKLTHEAKVHVMIFDQTLTDYQHVHPKPTHRPGVYQFEWTPNKHSVYNAWVDLTPLSTNHQEYIVADLGDLSNKPQQVDKTTSLRESISTGSTQLTFDLSFDPQDLTIGKAVMGKIMVKDASDKPYTQLEPIMGAFAHIVGINQDFKTIAHVHPMGREPSKSDDRGGPELDFHFVPEKPGFWKIWVQVKANGKELFIPFSVDVKTPQ